MALKRGVLGEGGSRPKKILRGPALVAVKKSPVNFTGNSFGKFYRDFFIKIEADFNLKGFLK